MTTPSLSALRLTRGHIKGSLTKLANYTESINDSVPLVDLEVRLNKTIDLWNEFNSSQKLLYEFVDKEGYVDPLPEYEEFESKFLNVHSVLLSAINERKASERAKDEVTRLADQQKVLIQALNKRPVNESDFFFPKIHIEPFTGNYQEWPTFRDMFESAVHNKTNLTGIQKFHFLRSCLRGDALSLLNHLVVSDATYEQAWEKLEKRYDRPRNLINSYVKSFFELPSVHTSNVNLLRKISDRADEIIRGLTSLNSKNRDPWVIYILLNKLDSETRQAWAEECVEEDYPTVDKLLSFLELRCEALESCKGSVRDSSRRAPAAKSLHVSSSFNCVKCNAEHPLSQCEDFRNLNVESRREFVRINKLCFNCLRSGHSSARCQSKFRCRTCNTRHHSLVHNDSVNTTSNPSVNTYVDKPSTSAAPLRLVNNHSTNFAFHVPETLLPTAIGKILDANGKFQYVRILIDSGSQVSFVTEACIQRLGVKRRNARIPISGIGSTHAGRSRGLSTLVIKSRCDNYSILVDTYILSNVTSYLPTNSFSIENWDHLHQLDLADPSFHKCGPVDILLGADKAWEILTGEMVHNKKGYPVAQNTIFGWVVAGHLPSKKSHHIRTHHATLDIDSILQSFWTIEEVDPKVITSQEDKIIEEHFTRTHRRDATGKYIVDLPFKSCPTFTDTLSGAISRLRSMEKRFSQNPSLFNAYSNFLDEYLSLGHMSEVPLSEITNSNVFYLPHHAVFKPDSTTTKLRVVFDGSHKDTSGNSLNDSLMIGPPIQRNLFSVCIRFRRHQFVFTADIVKMFRQIWISDRDSDYQRIVWRKSPSDPLRHFRLRTVTYGTSCAPFLSVRVLEQLAKDYAVEFPVASEIVLNDFYVDDVVSGGSTLEEAIFKQKSLIELLSRCDMHLSKWQSNCPELLHHTETPSQENILLDSNADSWTKVLGLFWNSKSDVFSFRLSHIPNETVTKRQILRDVSRIFDPLGFLAPSVVLLKIVFQELWHQNLEWDAKIPDKIVAQWVRYRNELSSFTNIKVPRVLGLGISPIQIHGFSDASASAYAAVIYSRFRLPTGEFKTNIVAAKSRVAPIKQLSIPRLELCGAVLLTRLLVAVQRSLNVTFPEVYAWCDSQVVLSWLSSPPRRWNIFVGNRTSEILNTIPRNRWFHVKSTCNPADCASRGIPPSQLVEHPIWWTGPAWLQQPDSHWPIANEFEEDPKCKAEERTQPKYQSYLTTHEKDFFETLSKRISSWNIFIRTVARIHRFIPGCRKQALPSSLHLEPYELSNAKMKIIKWLQRRYFGDFILALQNNKSLNKHCQLIQLSPFLDTENILRVGGRIEQADISYNAKHPIIIPKGHPITKLIVIDAHIRFLHPGVSTLFALLRQEYWIIGARNLIRSITHNCIRCFRQKRATVTQLMGNLPRPRVQTNRPFAHCGCDYAGPITLKVKSGRKCSLSKGYISLFVCLVTKAIHLELVTDLTTDTFLAALRRFVARRGKPSHIYSDNGTNFRGSARQLSEMHELVLSENHNSLVADSLARDGISWHFIPPSAPHFGGLWEAGVKSVKQHLRRVINNDVLSFEQMYTLLTQIEAILNSRPLCQLSDNELDALTPAHFIIGESYVAVPEPSIQIPMNRLSCWQQLQAKIQGYWKRWHLEYLTSLQNRPRWQHRLPNIKLNDLVVIKEGNLPPGKWAMGRVIEIHPGNDGHVRVVTLKTATGNLIRPVHKLAVLPVS